MAGMYTTTPLIDGEQPSAELDVADLFQRLLEESPEVREAELLALLSREAALDHYERRLSTLSRLRALLALDRSQARIIAAAQESALSLLPGEEREAVEESERDAVLHALGYADFLRLGESLPSARTLLPLEQREDREPLPAPKLWPALLAGRLVARRQAAA